MQRARGMTPSMFGSYIRGMYYAGLNPEKTSGGARRLTQTMTVGKGVAASAGTHDQQGTITDSNGNQIAYGVCIDINTSDLNTAQIKKMLLEMAKQGWAGWYRFKGKFSGKKSHAHLLYCGHYIKDEIIVAQVIDYLNNRTGLVGHAEETFYTAPTEVDKPLAQMFVRANPNRRKRVPKHLLTG